MAYNDRSNIFFAVTLTTIASFGFFSTRLASHVWDNMTILLRGNIWRLKVSYRSFNLT